MTLQQRNRVQRMHMVKQLCQHFKVVCLFNTEMMCAHQIQLCGYGTVTKGQHYISVQPPLVQ